MKLSGWGRTTSVSGDFVTISDSARFAEQLSNEGLSAQVLPRGSGRSYGDQALTDGQYWSSRRLGHFLNFDENTGLLEVEAGVTLGEIQRAFIPQGWSLAVTPGTQFVSVGGAIANDVHGKNHHTYGTFGEHVTSLELLRTNGEVLLCSNTQNTPMLRATIGGLGLTGFIIKATIKLRRVRSPWIDAQTLTFGSIEEFFEQTADSANHEFTVSWLDIKQRSLRGLFNRGNLADVQPMDEPKGLSVAVPFVTPFSMINRLTRRPLASAYNWLGSRNTKPATIHYQPFFYPLDGIATGTEHLDQRVSTNIRQCFHLKTRPRG